MPAGLFYIEEVSGADRRCAEQAVMLIPDSVAMAAYTDVGDAFHDCKSLA
jgi:hypothetical protein